MTKLTCRHCCERHANRPRQLCWRCYYTPGVKDQYPNGNSYLCGMGNSIEESVLDDEGPTDTSPGTADRLAVLASRARRGKSLFHPGDCLETGDRRAEKWKAKHERASHG